MKINWPVLDEKKLRFASAVLEKEYREKNRSQEWSRFTLSQIFVTGTILLLEIGEIVVGKVHSYGVFIHSGRIVLILLNVITYGLLKKQNDFRKADIVQSTWTLLFAVFIVLIDTTMSAEFFTSLLFYTISIIAIYGVIIIPLQFQILSSLIITFGGLGVYFFVRGAALPTYLIWPALIAFAVSNLIGYNVSIIAKITNRKAFAAYKSEQTTKLDLQNALDEIKTLQGILPICSYCKKIRNDEGAWNTIESYIAEHTDVQWSHGMCPDCLKKMNPGLYEKRFKKDSPEKMG